jgi:hypothetical protein
MTFKTVLLTAALTLALAAPATAAMVVNPSFETGDLSGWDATPDYVEVVTEADDAIAAPPFGQHYDPTEGDFFARLTAGSDVGVYTTLSQAFTITSQTRVRFDAAFLAFDYAPFNDDAYVRVYSLGGEEIVFASSVLAVGDQGHTDWRRYVSSLIGPGDYVLEAGVRNIDDPDPLFSSKLLIDNVTLAVPEPGAWAMMIGGFAAVGAMLRRRRAMI